MECKRKGCGTKVRNVDHQKLTDVIAGGDRYYKELSSKVKDDTPRTSRRYRHRRRVQRVNGRPLLV